VPPATRDERDRDLPQFVALAGHTTTFQRLLRFESTALMPLPPRRRLGHAASVVATQPRPGDPAAV